MFPSNFSSKKEYDNYNNCLSNLNPGDIIFFQDHNKMIIETIFLYKTLIINRGGVNGWSILVGAYNNLDFFTPSPFEKQTYLAPAKKKCAKILISKMKICWIPLALRINKIVKYNAQKEKEKKEKQINKKEKSVRSRRSNAE